MNSRRVARHPPQHLRHDQVPDNRNKPPLSTQKLADLLRIAPIFRLNALNETVQRVRQIAYEPIELALAVPSQSASRSSAR